MFTTSAMNKCIAEVIYAENVIRRTRGNNAEPADKNTEYVTCVHFPLERNVSPGSEWLVLKEISRCSKFRKFCMQEETFGAMNIFRISGLLARFF